MWARRLLSSISGVFQTSPHYTIRKGHTPQDVAIPMTSRQFTNEYTEPIGLQACVRSYAFGGVSGLRVNKPIKLSTAPAHDACFELTQSGGSEQDGAGSSS